MNVMTTRLVTGEYEVLRKFLYLAIFVPEGGSPPDPAVLNEPELQVYLDHFGDEPDDVAVAVRVDGEIVGAAWARVMDDYGHLYDSVPSLAISLLPEYRGMGLGKRLLSGLLDELRGAGHDRVTLAVQKGNRAACGLYTGLGFETVGENHEEYLMVKSLTEGTAYGDSIGAHN